MATWAPAMFVIIGKMKENGKTPKAFLGSPTIIFNLQHMGPLRCSTKDGHSGLNNSPLRETAPSYGMCSGIPASTH